MEIRAIETLPTDGEPVIVVALAADTSVPTPWAATARAALDRGEARTNVGHLAQLEVDDRRVVLVGVGAGEEEALRVAAAHVVTRVRAMAATTLCWVLPEWSEPRRSSATTAIVEGTLLKNWDYPARRRAKAAESGLEALLLFGGSAEAAATAASVGGWVNWARLQQHEPPNILTPTELASRAVTAFTAADDPRLSWSVIGETEMAELGMGALLAVSQGSAQEAALITARYRHPEATGPCLALVGKAVTFDAGGISIKPAARMHEMKSDMTGGAVVLGAFLAVVELGLPLDLLVVVGSTENLLSGEAYKPGDIVTAADGTTIEITNTDAEGRLVLADCLWHAKEQGAEVLVDVATLTGAVTVALGSTHAGLISTNDTLAGELLESGIRTGELAWRLPLHPEYAKLMKSQDADLINGSLERKAGTITGGYFLSWFTGDTPWAHLDIAGTGWGLGRAYTPRGGAAYGLRLLVDWLRQRAA